MSAKKAASSILVFLISLWCLAADPTWIQKMQDLAGAIYDLFPYIEIESSVPKDELSAKVKRVAELSESIDQHLASQSPGPDMDPTLSIVARQFRSLTQYAQVQLDAGDEAGARSLLRNSLSYCIACHTSGQVPPVFPNLNQLEGKFGPFSWIRRVELASALGQSDTVFQWMREALKGRPETIPGPDLERGVRLTLAGAVRVKGSLAQTEQLVRCVLNSPFASVYLKDSAKGWLEDLKKVKALPPAQAEPEWIERARDLLGDPARNRELPLPRRHEILYLEVSQSMHEFLRRFPSSPDFAQALYLLGIAYDGLRDIGLWTLHEEYYEACIRRVPHTDLARSCFARYERALTEGSGRPHTRAPFSRMNLEELRAMAL